MPFIIALENKVLFCSITSMISLTFRVAGLPLFSVVYEMIDCEHT